MVEVQNEDGIKIWFVAVEREDARFSWIDAFLLGDVEQPNTD
jgi:hypothetical protein